MDSPGVFEQKQQDILYITVVDLFTFLNCVCWNITTPAP